METSRPIITNDIIDYYYIIIMYQNDKIYIFSKSKIVHHIRETIKQKVIKLLHGDVSTRH